MLRGRSWALYAQRELVGLGRGQTAGERQKREATCEVPKM